MAMALETAITIIIHTAASARKIQWYESPESVPAMDDVHLEPAS